MKSTAACHASLLMKHLNWLFILVPVLVSCAPVGDATPTTLATNISSFSEEIIDSKGVVMRFVPAGEFTMGNDRAKSEDDVDEKPAHRVYLDAFYIDKYEVTNSLYAACVDKGVCEPQVSLDSYTRSSYYGDSQFDDYPVISVDWHMANTYCEWRGAHLPTEAQWEKAARGTDARTYPWGEGIDCNKANYQPCIGDTAPVGSYESGVSPYGLYDMAGNVMEWVADWYSETYYQMSPVSNPLGPDSGSDPNRVLRGGSWISTENMVRAASRHWPWNAFGASFANIETGFRCALRMS
jgi:formylglycine-generating enzyme required for sulfatase activity